MVSAAEPGPRRRHALVAGGGTGGHVFPALALAAELRDRGWSVSFVGRSGQMEERLAVRDGIPFLALPAAPVVGTSVGQKLRALWTTMRSVIAGRQLVRTVEADVVVGMGGYVSVPAVLGARLAGRRTLLFEPNADVGVANRWLSRCAGEAAVAYGAAADSLACPTVETGTPVRAEFFRQPETVAASPLQLLVLGGSQGARQINELVPAALAKVECPMRGLRLIHQAGRGNVESTRTAYERVSLDQCDVEVTDFLHDVAGALGSSQLVISRAGAVTLAELCAVGRPAILIPLEIAGGHQRANAEALVAAAAAEALPSHADANTLAHSLERLLGEPERLVAMGRAARSLGRPRATEELADRVVALGGGK